MVTVAATNVATRSTSIRPWVDELLEAQDVALRVVDPRSLEAILAAEHPVLRLQPRHVVLLEVGSPPSKDGHLLNQVLDQEGRDCVPRGRGPGRALIYR